MYADRKRRIALFRVPKVAGHSLAAVLRPLGFIRHMGSHPRRWSAEELLGESLVSRIVRLSPEIAAYRKAGFVRHPEERLASAWRYISLRCRAIPESRLGFDEFVERVITADRPIHHGTLWHAGISQVTLLCDRGELAVDFLGRYESLAEDFDRFCRWACVSPTPSLPVINSSGPPIDYRTWYAPELRRRVQEYFHDDYQTFGYQ